MFASRMSSAVISRIFPRISSRTTRPIPIALSKTFRSLTTEPNGKRMNLLARARAIETTYPWPVPKENFILNVCPMGERMIVERLGALHSIRKPGWFFAIPFIDRIAFRVDMRERALEYPPQQAITKDNVSVNVAAVLFVQFNDAEKACYGAANPLTAILELAKSGMRTSVGEMELDELFHSRKIVNDTVRNVLQEAAANWGLVVTRHEILDVTPDAHISVAMDKQAAAERLRREKVLEAEGEKRAAELKSEGAKIRMQNESEGMLIQITNEAKANAQAKILKAEADANAMAIIAKALDSGMGREAAKLAVARDYIDMYGEMGAKSNTIMVDNKPANVNSLLARAALAVGAVEKQVDTAVVDTATSLTG